MGDIAAAEAHLKGLFTLVNMRRPEEWQHRFWGILQRVILVYVLPPPSHHPRSTNTTSSQTEQAVSSPRPRNPKKAASTNFYQPSATETMTAPRHRTLTTLDQQAPSSPRHPSSPPVSPHFTWAPLPISKPARPTPKPKSSSTRCAVSPP